MNGGADNNAETENKREIVEYSTVKVDVHFCPFLVLNQTNLLYY